MPNVCGAVGLRPALAVLLLLITKTPVGAQVLSEDAYQPGVSRNFRLSPWDFRTMDDELMADPGESRLIARGPATVSSDVLRHPLAAKARRLLEKAMHRAELGDHRAAIQGLREALVKYPASAPYTHNLLGLEYIENRQYQEARNSFAEAMRLMPHESGNHSNLGLSLVIAGEWSSAEQEARKAIQLDPANSKAKSLLGVLLSRQHKAGER